MAQHTPGPWEPLIGLKEDDMMRCAVVAVRGKTQYLLATIENGAPGDFCETEESNAHLIAAAPDLLAAARRVRARCQSMRLDSDASNALDALSAAIAKATLPTPSEGYQEKVGA